MHQVSNLKLPPVYEFTVAHVRAGQRRGLTLREIADYYGVEISRVHALVNRWLA